MKTRRIAAAVLVSFLSTVSLPRPAARQDDAVTVQARARFKEGVDAFDKGKFEEARLAFLQAYTLKKHPSVLLNLAQSSAKSGPSARGSEVLPAVLEGGDDRDARSSGRTPRPARGGPAEARSHRRRRACRDRDHARRSRRSARRRSTPVDVEPGKHTVKSPTQSVTVTAVIGQKVEAKLGPQASSSTPPVVPVAPPADTTPAPHPSPGRRGPEEEASAFSPPENMTPVYVGLGVAGAGLVGAIVFAAFKADAAVQGRYGRLRHPRRRRPRRPRRRRRVQHRPSPVREGLPDPPGQQRARSTRTRRSPTSRSA